jgi:phosphatidylserine decarboxylase
MINQAILRTYARTYNCNLDEMQEPLESYKSLQQFFTRRLIPGARPFVSEGIASPVDGVVMSIHRVKDQTDHVDQVKDVTYSLSGFIGEIIPRSETPEQPKDIYHCIIYLAPGDYHGIHSPVDWSINVRFIQFLIVDFNPIKFNPPLHHFDLLETEILSWIFVSCCSISG